MTRLAIFDCDGTLVDSQANICMCMEQAFAKAGVAAPPRAAIRRVVGLSLAEVIAALAPAADASLQQRLVADYRAAFFELRTSGAMADEPLFDGIETVLSGLAEDGWLLGIATGKSDRGLAHILASHRLTDRFVTLQTADRHPSKPHPAMIAAAVAEAGADPAQTAMIGDTSYDMMMARAAGVSAIGVGWGYHPAAELTAAGAHAVASTVAELPQLLEAIWTTPPASVG